jgi:ankyrin repeat protein
MEIENIREVIITKELLIENPTIVHKKYDGQTLLMYACTMKTISIVQLLLDYGSDVNMVGEFDYTPLICACFNDDVEIVKLLLAYGANIDVVTVDLLTPLMISYSDSTIELTHFLLEQGVNVNAQDKYGKTILIHAIDKDDEDTIKLLVKYGADANIRCNKYQNALHHACLVQAPCSIIKLLLDICEDIDIDECDYDNECCEIGWNALLLICKYGCNKDSIEILQLLIDYSADVNAYNEDGESALMLASLNDTYAVEFVQLLLKHGANYNYENHFELNVLHQLCISKDITPKALKILIQHGANVNNRNIYGGTALLNYCGTHEYCSPDIIRVFIDYGIDINFRNNDYNRYRDKGKYISDESDESSSEEEDSGIDVRLFKLMNNTECMKILLSYIPKLNVYTYKFKILYHYVEKNGFGIEYINELNRRDTLKIKQNKIYDKVLKYIQEHDAAVRFKIGNMGYKICKYYEDKIVTQELLDYLGATTETIDKLVDVYLGY